MPVHALTPARKRRTSQPVRRLQAFLGNAFGRLLRWHELARQRRALLALNERMLRDIGITRAEAEREARRPFWCDGSGDI